MHIDFATQIFNDKSMKVMLKVSWEQFTMTKNLRRSASILSDSQLHNFLSIIIHTYDLSIASTKTKYIKLNTKTQNISFLFKWKFDDFFIHFDRGDKKKKEKKSFLF